jgi:transposase
MSRALQIVVIESKEELRRRMKGLSTLQCQKLQMLLLIQKGSHTTLQSLSEALGVTEVSIHSWRTKYRKAGLDFLLLENRGGNKKAQINQKAYTAIEHKLSSPTEGFSSYIEAQEWINKNFGLQMGYHAVNKFIKRKFGARLKVGRKSHVLKEEQAVAVFKKPTSKIRTY